MNERPQAYDRIDTFIRPYSGFLIRALQEERSLPNVTEVIRHALGLYQYGKATDDRGLALHADCDGELSPIKFPPDIEPYDGVSDLYQLGVYVNEECSRILIEAETATGLPDGDIIDQSLRFMADIVGAQKAQVPLKVLPKSDQ